MKKIIIVSTTIVSITIIMLAVFIYKKQSNENENTSAFQMNVFERIDNSNSGTGFSHKIAQKIKDQEEYAKNIKKTMTSSNIPNINNEQIMEALNTLVNDNSGVNHYDPNQSQFKMEFELTHVPLISQYKIADGIDHYSYRIDYEHIIQEENYTGFNYMPSVNNMSLIENNTFINPTMARYFSVSIYMNYDADENYTSRKRSSQHVSDIAENSESRDIMLSKVEEDYPERAKFTQGVSFIMRNIKFSGKLNVPRVINIWNERSSELFPCHLYSNELIQGYKESPDTLINNDEYSLQYYCLKLPNYNDYTGNLKILFD
jgi:hypothetical protein